MPSKLLLTLKSLNDGSELGSFVIGNVQRDDGAALKNEDGRPCPSAQAFSC